MFPPFVFILMKYRNKDVVFSDKSNKFKTRSILNWLVLVLLWLLLSNWKSNWKVSYIFVILRYCCSSSKMVFEKKSLTRLNFMNILRLLSFNLIKHQLNLYGTSRCPRNFMMKYRNKSPLNTNMYVLWKGALRLNYSSSWD